jgi:phosphoribosylpyrophosphate synthetase
MEASLIKPKHIVLIDDFVTRGATFVGAASRVQSEITDVEIKAFALVRSITDGEIEAIREPVTGTIELASDGESRRRP